MATVIFLIHQLIPRTFRRGALCSSDLSLILSFRNIGCPIRIATNATNAEIASPPSVAAITAVFADRFFVLLAVTRKSLERPLAMKVLPPLRYICRCNNFSRTRALTDARKDTHNNYIRPSLDPFLPRSFPRFPMQEVCACVRIVARWRCSMCGRRRSGRTCQHPAPPSARKCSANTSRTTQPRFPSHPLDPNHNR